MNIIKTVTVDNAELAWWFGIYVTQKCNCVTLFYWIKYAIGKTNKIKILHVFFPTWQEVSQSHTITYVYENIGLILHISVSKCWDTKKKKYSELYGSKYSNTFTQSVSLKMYFNVWLPPLHKWTLNNLHQQRTGTLIWCPNAWRSPKYKGSRFNDASN